MKKTFKRLLSLMLVLLMLTSGVLGMTASATVSLPTISSSKYITCYTQKDYSDNTIRAYTDSTLTTKTGGYISISTDQCKILAFSSDGKAVKVKYPVSGGYKTAWFYRSHFFSRNVVTSGAISSLTATAKVTVYRWNCDRLNGTKNTSIGSISKGDKIYIVYGGTSSEWTQVIYPVSSNSTWKMGWVKTNQIMSVPSTKVALSATSASIAPSGTKTLKATMTPSYTTDSVTWKSSNTSVATVSSAGKVTGKATGTATITATTTSGKTATCKVTITNIPATKVTLSSSSVTLAVGNTKALTASLTPTNSTDSVKWTSSNTSVATVNSSGKITAKGKGTATITAMATSGETAKCTVKVTSTISLKVPYYMQSDSRWSGVYVGTKTIGKIGCLITSLAMKYSYDTGTTVYPDAMKNKLSFSNNDLYWSSVTALGYTHKSYSTSITNSIMKTIYTQLKKGNPVIIGGKSGSATHWVVITGYKGTSTTNFTASDFTINDPSSKSRTTLKQFLNYRPTVIGLVY